MKTQTRSFEYSMREAQGRLIIACGNVDNSGNWLNDGSYSDIMEFRCIDRDTAEKVLYSFQFGNAEIK